MELHTGIIGALLTAALGPAATAQDGSFRDLVHPRDEIGRDATVPPGLAATAGACAFYSSATAFDAAFPGLAVEDFEDANAAAPVVLCTGPVDAAGDGGICFDAGDIEVGLVIDNPDPAEVQFALFNEFAGLVGIGVGPVFPTGNGEIVFHFDPPVGQVGFDFWSPVLLDARIGVYAPDGALLLQQFPSSGGFYGYACEASIERVEVKIFTVGGPALDNVRFGDNPDCDGDGIPNDEEPDCDDDGVPDDCDSEPDDNGNGIPDPCEALGTRYCAPSVKNSTGERGGILATGSNLAEEEDLTLSAYNLPPGNLCLFLASVNQGYVQPPLSCGPICLMGPDIARFKFDVQAIDGEGRCSIDVAPFVVLTNPPQPILAGQTWNFQAWHRDSGAGPDCNNNFTDAVAIQFL